MPLRLPRNVLAALVAASALGCGPGPSAGPPAPPAPESGTRADAPMVQPGAPGRATRTVEASEIPTGSGLTHSPADVRFVQAMIPHHAQALVMTDLVRRRSADDGIRQLALRMDISQRDEIALMERWLRDRGVARDGGHASHVGHGGSTGDLMPGMLSPAEMDALAAAEGEAFDRLFLESMIRHHEGAIVMVAELFSAPGGGQESEIFQLASHIDADQRMEIDRMRRMLDDRR